MAFDSACGHKKSSSEELPFFIGADDEIRTRDIHLGKVVLYQLSYVRTCCLPGGCLAFNNKQVALFWWAILGSNQ